MFVPEGGSRSKDKDRADKVMDLINQCERSREQRVQLYEKRRRWTIFGTDELGAKTKYNRLMSHQELVSSFLFSPEHVFWSMSPKGAASAGGPNYGAMLHGMARYWTKEFRESGLGDLFGLAMLWALIYDSMFIKLGWHNRHGLFGRLIEPHSIGVYNESEPGIENQECFVHRYALPKHQVIMRMVQGGLGKLIDKLSVSAIAKDDFLPPVVSNMIISAASLEGPLIGQARPDFFQSTTYVASPVPDMIRMKELTIWDDLADDWRTFIVADPDIVISDSLETVQVLTKAQRKLYQGTECNLFLPGLTPYVQVTPFPMYDWFWGEAHTERLIPLQDWSNKRLDQIDEMLQLQVDPAKVARGGMGLMDEKMEALGGPGSYVIDQSPQFQVDMLRPDMPEDLFAEYDKIGGLMLEASGLTQTLAGEGAEGVRSKGHAKQLAVTGSGRIKKTAAGLEGALAAVGERGIRLVQHNDETPLEARDKSTFIPAHIEDFWTVRVAGHSHSPLFADDTKQTMVELLKTGAIDQEDLLLVFDPPDVEWMIQKWHERSARLSQEQQNKALQEAMRSHHAKSGQGGGE